MRCPFCLKDNDKVIDSRSAQEGKRIRRRRECLSCQKRFTTYEVEGEKEGGLPQEVADLIKQLEAGLEALKNFLRAS